METIKQHLINDWQAFADRFIPMYSDSIQYAMHNPDLMLDQDRVLDKERKLTMIRNCLHASSLRRPFKDCTPTEIAEDKLKRLTDLLTRRPELKKLIKERL